MMERLQACEMSPFSKHLLNSSVHDGVSLSCSLNILSGPAAFLFFVAAIAVATTCSVIFGNVRCCLFCMANALLFPL